jgi:amino acid adenylation domain-containing protein
MTQMLLHECLSQSARIYPEQTAIEDSANRTVTYRELALLSDCVRDRLVCLGVGLGARVGIYLEKSIEAVASIFGILKAGAAYVPVDPNAPAWRNAYILNDCSVKAVIADQRFEANLRAEIKQGDGMPHFIFVPGTRGGGELMEALGRAGPKTPVVDAKLPALSPDNLAYILYTSGSTGKPKGVMLSHRNALSFVHWCSEVFQPGTNDCFSSHAPFHFDLSILDVYVSIKHGAKLVLIGDEIGKDPLRLASVIAQRKISIWYSAPSILSLLAQYGNLGRYDYSSLRMVLFAGEVFPLKYLRALKSQIPGPRYFNLYGPTETNVCTFYEIPAQIPESQISPYPIGKACSHLQTKVVGELGQEVGNGEGELCVHGPAVTKGYWNLPDATARSFIFDSRGQPWYQTGDIVVEDANGNYCFLGRRDRMIKKRGYRVELGEIEACLYRHSAVQEAGVVALQNQEEGVRIKAFLRARDGDERRLSRIELKRFCAENLPLYMVPDLFAFEASLPKTSTGKIDYQALKEMG